jgi:EAL domain-containing protein (putative c-di-GMP-specific phosphodiesterase class I)
VRLQDILKEEAIEVHFQPLVSIQEKSVVGFEGLSRGVEMPTGRLIPPVVLIRKAVEEELSLELDALFRKKVFQSFREQFYQQPRLILTVNLETSLGGESSQDALDLDTFSKLSRKYEVDPARVAIEIVESRAKNTHLLERFIEAQKERGFMVALDDVGSGHSNLDRIARMKPDLIKIDRSLILDIQKEYHKQEVFRSLVGLSRQIGALVVAEGVETEDEALWSLELGADILQGYFFARPQRMDGGLFDRNEEVIDEVARRFRSMLLGTLHDKREMHRRCEARLGELRKALKKVKPRAFDGHINDLLEKHPDFEAVYILDEAGVQVTHMAHALHGVPEHARVFCKPWERGTDHSLRDFYCRLVQGDPRDQTHVTDPYVSLATGQRCVTLSTYFRDAYDRTYVLCVDMRVESV